MTIDTLAALTLSTYARSARILRILAAARLVKSTRGPGGGWRLSLPPHCISLLQVVTVLRDNGAETADGALDDQYEGPTRGSGIIKHLLERSEESAHNLLASVSLADVLAAEASSAPDAALPEHSHLRAKRVGRKGGG